MSIHDEIQRAREIWAVLKNDDDRDSIIETETDIYKILDWAMFKYGEAVTNEDAIDHYIQILKDRKERVINRQDSMREIMQLILPLTKDSKKYKGAAGTVYYQTLRPKKLITDEAQIPDRFFKKVVDKTAINEHDGDIPGVTISNGGESLVVRIK